MFEHMSLGFRLAISICALVSTVAIAADNPPTGTWKLNTGISTLKGCPSYVLRRQTLRVRSDIATASANPRTATEAKHAGPFDFGPVVSLHHLSPDGRILTATPASASDCKMVYERQ
jgi:hypothetical protein